MKKLMVIFALLALSSFTWADQSKAEVQDRLDNAAKVLHEIMATPDKGIPEEVLDGAKCVAVVPHMIKGGFVFGAQHGRGVATCRLSNGGWSAPAFSALTGGSWGAQIGAEGVDLVMMVMNEAGMRQLLSDKFQIGAQASASAGPVGRHVSGETDWKMAPEIFTYSRSKGLFAGATLEGAGVRQDDDSTKAIYGMAGANAYKRILTGEVPAPPVASTFLGEIRTISAVSAEKHEEKKASDQLPASDKDSNK
jgi:lipid-binding SYLF domain-containing protein